MQYELELFNQYEEISVKDVEKKLLVSRSSALRRLNEKINEGVVEKIGHKRSVRYKLINRN